MREVEWGVVDDVPVVVGGCPGPTMGVLMARVGVCDEVLPERGITHLVEHLALAGFDSRQITFNGSVGPSLCSFVARGTTEEVCRHLTEVTRALADLPLERASHEARILRAEAAQRGPTAFGHASLLRYGPANIGLLDYEELFLLDPSPDALAAHAEQYFTRGNCAVALSQPPTADLDLSALPLGERAMSPPATPLSFRYPAWDVHNSSGVALSNIVTRDVTVPMASWILSEHLRAVLREELGLSYSVGSVYEPWTATEAHHMIWADCRPEDTTVVAERLQTELSRIVIDGIAAKDIDDYRRLGRRADEEPTAPYGAACYHATEHIFGNPPETASDIDARVRSVTPADVQQLVRQFQRTALWLVPQGVSLADRRLRLVPQWSDHTILGQQYASAAAGDDQVIVASREGVSLVVDEHRRVSIRCLDTAAYVRRLDGSRTVLGKDAFRLHITPSEWRRGDHLVTSLDTVMPPDVTVTERPI